MKCISIHIQQNDYSLRTKICAKGIFGTQVRLILLVTASPHYGLFPRATCLIQCGNTKLSTVPRGSRSSKSVDDLMQDEKRQHHFFFTIPHGIYFLSTLIILWSIKACSKSRCILPQADSTCKHFLSRTPLPSPEAKHDYPILMRFLMWFFL